MARVLVIGAEGQLGSEVCKAFEDTEVFKADLDGPNHVVNVCEPDAVDQLIAETGPEVVINTSAFHNVPECETDPGKAFAVNAIGARNLAVSCQVRGARLVHISTDYVFGHGVERPLTEACLPVPLNVYGASKLAGEHLIAAECTDHCIVRTAALYGPAACRAKGGRNFPSLMLHLAETKGEVRVVTDEITTPTYTVALARQLRAIAERATPGLYHATCQGACSWHAFARAVFDLCGTQVRLLEATTADFPSPVKRPRYSVLANVRLRDQGLDLMPDWREALEEYLRHGEASS